MNAGPGESGSLRILMVNDQPPGRGGGVEVHLTRLTAGLVALGHFVDHFSPSRPHQGVRRIADLWDPRAAAELRTALVGFDVVHVHNFLRELSPSVLSRGTIGSCPGRVVTIHDHRLFQFDRPRPHLMRWHEVSRFAYAVQKTAAKFASHGARHLIKRNVDRTIATSEELASELAYVGIPATVIHPCGVDVYVEPLAPRGRMILYAGRLAKSKGIHILIEACAGLPPGLGASLVIAGSGPDETWLRGLVPETCGATIHFVGDVAEAEVQSLLAESTVACLPSIDAEGWPLFVVEAMSAGRPVVVSDHPSLNAMVGGKVRGIVVPPNNVYRLRSALEQLLSDATLAARLGGAGREYASSTLSPGHAIDRTIAVYRGAIALRNERTQR